MYDYLSKYLPTSAKIWAMTLLHVRNNKTSVFKVFHRYLIRFF